MRSYCPLTVEDIVPSKDMKIVVVDFSSVAKQVLRYLKKKNDQNVLLIVLEGVPSVERAKSLLAEGVKGYGNAYMQPIHLQSCVETVKSGKIWVYPEFVYAMVEELHNSRSEKDKSVPLPHTLTKREKELVEQVLCGASNKEIAERLGISERTVKAHLANIYKKMDVSNRLELALKLNKTEVV